MYIFGYIKQFPIHRYSWLRSALSVIEIALASTLRYAKKSGSKDLTYVNTLKYVSQL